MSSGPEPARLSARAVKPIEVETRARGEPLRSVDGKL
jgi:hypothetical protein